MHLPKRLQLLMLLTMLTSIVARSQGTPPGTLLQDKIVNRETVQQVGALLGGFPSTLSIVPKYAIDFHAITYTTTDLSGQPVIASGMVVIPDGATSLPVVSYQHGTVLEKNNAPSNPRNNEIELVGAFYASTGYLLVSADYLGLGASPGRHPYLHAATEASACRDMLRASRELCKRLHLTWGPKLFLTGYSQGGHATMALHRALQNDPTKEFIVTASAPQSGPYDLSDIEFRFALAQRNSRALSVAAAYILYTYNWVYNIYPTVGRIFTPRYAELVPQLFDNRHDYDDVYLRMPASPRDLLNAPYASAIIADPLHPMRQALHANDVYDWRPTCPVRLYFIPNDAIVSPDNARVAYNRMISLGVDVKLVDLHRGHTHTTAFIVAQVATKAWFDTLR